MKKRIISFISLLIFITLPLLASCGSDVSNNYYTAQTKASQAENYFAVAEDMDIAFDVEKSVYLYSSKSEDGSSVSNQSPSAAPASGRKIIYSSSFDIETKEYEKSLNTLNSLCTKYGAYFENSNTYGTSETSRNSSFTVRVPVENYYSFIGEAQSIGVVISSSEDNTDITEQYFDTEARLSSAQLREERVLKILENAGDLDDVLALERELSDIRYEIESYIGSLRKYDSLVSFSTVRISIREIRTISNPPNQVLTFGEKTGLAFKNGINDFVEAFESFVVFLSYNTIRIAIFLVVVLIIIIVIVSLKKKKREAFIKATQSNPQVTNDNNSNNTQNK